MLSSISTNFGVTIRPFVLQCGIVMLLGCGGVPPQEPQPFAEGQYGWLVLGDRAARAFALDARDTLFELRNREISESVMRSATSFADSAGFQPRCSRLFRATGLFVTLLSAGCAPQQVREDGDGLVVFTLDGQRLGPALMTLRAEDIVEVRPSHRMAAP